MKKNIGDKLRSEPVNIRSSQKINDTKRSRRKLGLPPRSRSGKVLERTLGAPLMAGFYGTDDRSNECPIGYIYDPSTGSCIIDWNQNTVNAPWNWDPATGSNWGGWTGGPPNIIDESIGAGDVSLNPDLQPGFGSEDYNPTGESFGFGNMGLDWGDYNLGGSPFIYNTPPTSGEVDPDSPLYYDPFAGGPEDQPGFGWGQYDPDSGPIDWGSLGLDWGEYDIGEDYLEPIIDEDPAEDYDTSDDPIQGCPGPICPDGSCAYQLSNDQGPAGQWYCGDGPGTGGVDPGGYLPGGN
jgi:hypothetical protein